jgi:hypothetical protein
MGGCVLVVAILSVTVVLIRKLVKLLSLNSSFSSVSYAKINVTAKNA